MASLAMRVFHISHPGKEAKMYRSLRTAAAVVRRHGDLYFAALLPEDHILKAFAHTRSFWQGWIYTPAVTVWVFLSQCFSAGSLLS